MSTATATPAEVPVEAQAELANGPTFLGHPIGLFILFFTEMWERFSYYGMRGLLKLYMVNYLFVTSRQVLQGGNERAPGNPDDVLGWGLMKHLVPSNPAEAASVLYGLYTALVYLTPLFGGTVADRLLGQRKTVIVGGILMAIGHFVMAFENQFFVALTFLIIGNGAFKPNVSTQVGALYKQGDSRRDGAFSIFYMGINLGAFLCNFVCGTLAAFYGWHYGFAAAGVGMVIGLVVYVLVITFSNNILAPDNLMKKEAAGPAAEAQAAPASGGNLALILYGVDALCIVATIAYGKIDGWTLNKLITILFLVTAAFFINRLTKTSPPLQGAHEWGPTLALVALCALNVVFWAVYEQQGNTMQSWADEQTIWPTIPLILAYALGGLLAGTLLFALIAVVLVIARVLPSGKNRPVFMVMGGGALAGLVAGVILMVVKGHTLGELFPIPSTFFQSFNPLCIIIFAPLLDIFWGWQNKRGSEPSSVSKMAIGCIVLGLSFIVMIVGARVVGDGKGSTFWPLFCTFLLTIGELYLSPIGLSLVTKVSPARIVSMMMGMWFMSSFLGNYLSGAIGVLYTRWSHDAFFGLLTVLGVGAGLAIWAFNKPLKNAIGSNV